MLLKIVLGYLVVSNIITFCVYGSDKFAARMRWRRVPERTLLGLALAGGSVGALLGMALFRHKISKDSFQFPLAIILFVQVGLVLYVMQYAGAS